MTEAAKKLLDQVLALSEDERVMVADGIWDSLSEESRALLPDDTAIDPELCAELERRMDEVDKHPERLIDAEEVLAAIRARSRPKAGQ